MNAMHEYYCNKLDELSGAYDEMTQQANGMMKNLNIVGKAFSKLQTEAGRRSQDDEN